MNHIDGMAHPLIGNPAGEFLVQPELAIDLRIERPIRLGQQPFAPIGILLADQLRLRASSPSRPVIIPDDFHLADVTQDAGLHHVMCGPGISFATMLRADLHDAVGSQHRIPRPFCLGEHIAHRLFNVGVLAGLHGHFQDR